MKRPLCTIGFSALCVLAVIFSFQNPRVWLCVGAGGLVVWGVVRLFRQAKPTVKLAILSGSLACLYAFCRHSVFTAPLLEHSGERVAVTGTVLEQEMGSGYPVYEVQLRNLAGHKAYMAQLRLYDYSGSASLSPGDGFSGEVYLYPIANQSANARLKGRLCGEVAAAEPSFLAPLYQLRAMLIEELREQIPDGRGEVAVGILTGDTSGISPELMLLFRRCGLSHILAVSGLHLTLLTSLIGLLLRRVSRRLHSVLASLFVLAFMAFQLFTVSVLRAGLMVLLAQAAQGEGKKGDTWNSLGFALTVVLALSPGAAADAGLQLSVSAVVGILLLSGPIARRLKIWLRREEGTWGSKAISILSVSLGASLGVFPVSLFRFGQASVLGVFTAIPVALLLPVILVCSLLGPALSLLRLPGLAGLFSAWDALAVWALCCVAQAAAWLPFGLLFGRDIPALVGLLLLGGGLWAAVRRLRKQQALFLAVGCLAVGAVFFLLEQLLWNTPCLLFPDRKSGPSAVLCHRNETIVVLADCSGNTAGELKALLESRRVHFIDFLFLMGDGRADMEACGELLASFPTGCLLLREENPFFTQLTPYFSYTDSALELAGSWVSISDGWEIVEEQGNLLLYFPDGRLLAFVLEEEEIDADWVIAEEPYWENPPPGTLFVFTEPGEELPEQVLLRERELTLYLGQGWHIALE